MLRSRRLRAQRVLSAAGLFSIPTFAAVVTGSCSDGVAPGSGKVDTVLVVPAVATVAIGTTFTLEAEARDATDQVIAGRKAFWAAEDPAIAVVTEDGRVTARRLGSVKVAASIEGKSGIATITVTNVPVASVAVSPNNATLLVGERKSFSAVVRDANGGILNNRPVAWRSSVPSVASINAKGELVALAPGSTIISAETEGRSGLAAVNVSAVPVAAVRITPTSATLTAGQSAQLQAEALDGKDNVLPGRQVLWFTSNASVATVSPNGNVLAVSAGSATISATSEGRTATATVSVTLPRRATVVISPATATIGVLESLSLTAEYRRPDGTVDTKARIDWSSSDTRVASVDKKGKVTGRFPGTATIRAKSGSEVGTATITVKIGG